MSEVERIPTEEQQRVINDFENNIMLTARAGSGKTFTIAHKVKAALDNGICKDSEILCLTFAVKACEELKESILSIMKIR